MRAAEKASPAGQQVDGRGWRWNAAHVALLHLAAGEAEAAPSAAATAATPTAPQAAGPAPSEGVGAASVPATAATERCLMEVLRASAADVAQAEEQGTAAQEAAAAEVSPPPAWPASSRPRVSVLQRFVARTTACPPHRCPGFPVQVMAAVLQVLRALVQREDGGKGCCGGEEDVVLLLQREGLVLQLLAMLAALGPPAHPRRPTPPQVRAPCPVHTIRPMPSTAFAYAGRNDWLPVSRDPWFMWLYGFHTVLFADEGTTGALASVLSGCGCSRIWRL